MKQPASAGVSAPPDAAVDVVCSGTASRRGGGALFAAGPDATPVAWRISPGLAGYPETVAAMETRAAEIAAGTAPELVWLLEHPPLYTAGTSARATDLVEPERFPVFRTNRGGQFTYHGPGQRVVYVMLDLNRRRRDVRAFVGALEDWLIATLAAFQVRGERRDDRVGVWVRRPDKRPDAEDKIAAIGVRVRRWVSFHGISLNVDPDLAHFGGIVPCGVRGHGVTSLADLGCPAAMADVDAALRHTFEPIFGRANPAAAPLVKDLAPGRSGPLGNGAASIERSLR